MDLDELDSFNNRSNGCENGTHLSSSNGANHTERTAKTPLYSSYPDNGEQLTGPNGSATEKEAECLHCVERMKNARSMDTSDGKTNVSLITNALQSLTSLWGASGHVKKTPDYVKRQTDTLATVTLQHVLHNFPEESLEPVARTLVTTVREILIQNEVVFSSMVHRLKITPSTAQDAFVGAANEMFEGDQISWARIVTLFAFAGRLAQYCVEYNMPVLAENMTSYLANYAKDRVVPFVCNNGGWDELCTQFPTKQSSSELAKKCLLLTGLGLGVAATIMALNR